MRSYQGRIFLFPRLQHRIIFQRFKNRYNIVANGSSDLSVRQPSIFKSIFAEFRNGNVQLSCQVFLIQQLHVQSSPLEKVQLMSYTNTLFAQRKSFSRYASSFFIGVLYVLLHLSHRGQARDFNPCCIILIINSIISQNLPLVKRF